MSELSPEIIAAIDAAVVKRLPAQRETYLKISEAAAQLNVHTDTALRLVHSGKLRAVGGGKLLRIPQSAIAACFPAVSV